MSGDDQFPQVVSKSSIILIDMWIHIAPDSLKVIWVKQNAISLCRYTMVGTSQHRKRCDFE